MSSAELAVVSDFVLAGLGGFLIWYVKKFVVAQIEAHGAALGEIGGKMSKLDDLETIERRLKQATADVELATNRRLHFDNLARTKDLEFRERQLSEFFWPLYMRLQMDNAVWELMDRIKPDAQSRDRELAATIEKKFILPNHRKALEIIESKRHLAATAPELEKRLLAYIRHIAVFEALRALEVFNRDPKDVGEPWPNDLFGAVRDATLKHEKEFTELVRRNQVESEGAPS